MNQSARRDALVPSPVDVFDLTVSRHRDGPELFLDGFTGSLMADCCSGYRAADLMTLVSSAARNDLDIFVYVTDVLDCLLAGETTSMPSVPTSGSCRNPEAVRIHRVEDRCSRPDAKAVKRARRRVAQKRSARRQRRNPPRVGNGGGVRSPLLINSSMRHRLP